ncbi:hypothetical protein CK934_16480 [Chitinophaga sp. MD30]|nr:hypothetical protein CK934_16480 [Chitinophaga sp. MD30]
MLTQQAQGQRTCASADALQERIKKSPYLLNKQQQIEQQLLQLRQMKSNQREAAQPVSIPVVVHIVLQNPAQITDAQVFSQIAVLNRDYTATNTDISKVPAVWKSIIGNTQYQFCLAQRTPNGDPSNGIIRVATTKASFSNPLNAVPDVKHANTGGSNAWDPRKYLNIWVCQIEGSTLGVATSPSMFPDDEDGVVILYTGFGTEGTAKAPFNLGRTVTHEIGHYFGLRHIWGDDDADGTARCTVDDGVDDTPLQGKRNFNCPTFPFTDNCSPAVPGIMFMNFMDYVDDACMYLFSAGQSERMRNTLTAVRPYLLTSDGCTPVNLAEQDASIQTVLSPIGQQCSEDIVPRVLLRNRGSRAITNVQIQYRIDNGTPLSFNWTGNLASLQQTEVVLPSSTSSAGIHTITAYSTLPNGVVDQNTANDTAKAGFRYDNSPPFPFSEGFEGNTFPPASWEIFNPDNSFTWEKTRDAARSGSASVVMRNLGYATNGQIDDLVSPVFDGRQEDSVFLLFDVAAALQSDPSSNNLWDSLEVLITTDCGKTLKSLYKRGGPDFVTRKTPVLTEFVPGNNEWRRDSINLTPYIKQGKFRIIFRNYSNYENNIYLDNINLTAKKVNSKLREKGVLVTPNPTSDLVLVSFYERPTDLEAVNIYNAMGQLIAQQPATALNNNRLTFDLVNEPNGVYFVKLIYKNRAQTIKISKVR